nr:isoprenyl transferase [Actinomyces minihominis]
MAAPGEGSATLPQGLIGHVPQHVAVIMDGNGRWANARGLPRTEGHRAGELALMDTVAGAVEAGVKYISMYAFSTENWKRSPAEVSFLMGYSRDVIRKHTDRLNDWGVRVRWVGRRPRLWKSVLKELRTAEEKTKHNTKTELLLCINYGGRAEIADAARDLAQEVADGKRKASSIREADIASHLYAADVPDVDLLIRTSGESRISNFLLWQLAYAELDFVPVPWPEFGREELWERLQAFQDRDRRFGGAIDAVGEDQAPTS